MYSLNTLIVIRMWSIFRNSVLKIDRLLFPQNLQFDLKAASSNKKKKYSKLNILTFVYEIKWYDSLTYGKGNPCSIFSNTVLNIDHIRNFQK